MAATLEHYRQALKDLYTQHGKLTAPMVVGAARNKAHPLHTAFEWNNSKAAEEYRLIQARHLIREVRFVYSDTRQKDPLIHVPVQYATSTSRTGEYHLGSVLALDDAAYDRALHVALMRLDSAEQAVLEIRRLRPTESKRLDVAEASIQAAKLALVS